jgi:predicted PurR-regulated permease PerM
MNKFNKSKLFKSKAFKKALPYCIAILFFLLMTHLDLIGRIIAALFDFILPVIVGIILAYIMDPPIRAVERKLNQRSVKHPRGKAIAIVIAIILVSLGLLVVAVVPQVVSSMVQFSTSKTSYHGELQQFVDQVAHHHVNMKSVFSTIDKTLDKMQNQVKNQFLLTTKSNGRHILNFAVDFILAIYFLVDKRRVQNSARNFFKLSMRDSTYQKFSAGWKRCDRIFIKYLICEVIDALIVGSVNAAFMLVCGMSYVPMISVVVGLTNLIPTFGPIIGAVVGAFVLMINNPLHALLFLAFTGLLQTVDGYLIKPKLYGDTLGVPGLLILIAVVLGGRIFGVLGMLFAIPVVAILDILNHETFLPYLRKKKIRRESRGKKKRAYRDDDPDALELLMQIQEEEKNSD